MDDDLIRSLVYERVAAAGISPADVTGITDCSTEDRVVARVTYSWGRAHEVDLGPTVDVVEAAIEEVIDDDLPAETITVSSSPIVDVGELEFSEPVEEADEDAPEEEPEADEETPDEE